MGVPVLPMSLEVLKIDMFLVYCLYSPVLIVGLVSSLCARLWSIQLDLRDMARKKAVDAHLIALTARHVASKWRPGNTTRT